MEVYGDTGNITNDTEAVLNKWENEFKLLFDRLKTSEHFNFDETFYEQVLNLNRI